MIRCDNIHRLVLDGPLDEKITSGGPIMECMTNITEWMRHEDLARLAQNREQWRILQPTFVKKTAHEDVDCLIMFRSKLSTAGLYSRVLYFVYRSNNGIND